ncbi:Plant organelle RNA recognition domain [Dillenia turbinata]|uniref:Plant organelle RNA recognition domain n=1 Tax=Dillenia turbinata TaxID=194707 RepID=A0AAN8WDF6_9MAGN
MRVLQRCLLPVSTPQSSLPVQFGPFNSITQRRWKKKPVDSAQTRLQQDRVRDHKIDKLVSQLRRLNIILKLHSLLSNPKHIRPFASLQLISRWRNIIGLGTDIGAGDFLRKYPHVFTIFTHPLKRNMCCKFAPGMLDLINEELGVVRETELECVWRIKKLLRLSLTRTLHVHALGLMKREFGLPEDYMYSILRKYSSEFRFDDPETVSLIGNDEDLGVAEIEKWREREYREKWLSEYETKYAFPINYPTGCKIESGGREKMRNWQRLPYVKPYEGDAVVVVRSGGGLARFEKRVVAVLHEFLSLTVEKMVEVERLSHFRKDLGIEVNVRELLLKHPGIFYISTKGATETVFLREAYSKGLRRAIIEDREVLIKCATDGDWVLPILKSCNDTCCEDNLGQSSNKFAEVHLVLFRDALPPLPIDLFELVNRIIIRLLEDDSSVAYSKTVQQNLDIISDKNKYPPTLDPSKLLLKASEDKRFVCVEADRSLDAIVGSRKSLPLLHKLSRVFLNIAHIPQQKRKTKDLLKAPYRHGNFHN